MKFKEKIEKIRTHTWVIITTIVFSILMFVFSFYNEIHGFISNITDSSKSFEVLIYDFKISNSTEWINVDKSFIYGSDEHKIITSYMTTSGMEFYDATDRIKDGKIDCLSYKIQLRISNEKDKNYSLDKLELLLIGDTISENIIEYVGSEFYFLDNKFDISNPSIFIQPNEVRIVKINFVFVPYSRLEEYIMGWKYKKIILNYFDIKGKKYSIIFDNPMQNMEKIG